MKAYPCYSLPPLWRTIRLHGILAIIITLTGVVGLVGCGKNRVSRKDFERIKLAAEKGDASAQNTLGNFYADGNVIDESIDKQKAFSWWQKAAENGNFNAMYKVGASYFLGTNGVPQDPQRALKWFQEAASKGHPRAQVGLAKLYAGGLLGTNDYLTAQRWLKAAADSNF